MNNFEDDSSIYKPSAHSYKLSAFQIWLIFSGNELYCWLLSVNHWQWHHPTNGDYYITIQEQANRVKISVGFVEKKNHPWSPEYMESVNAVGSSFAHTFPEGSQLFISCIRKTMKTDCTGWNIGSPLSQRLKQFKQWKHSDFQQL